MNSAKRLKDLRDALWQAAIELKRPAGEITVDPYQQPLDELAEDLAAHQVLTDREAKIIIDFLNRFDPVEEVDEGTVSEEIPDDLDTELAAIAAELRSLRRTGDRDVGAWGPGGGEQNVVQEKL
jgi:hypothetical protein